MSHPRPASTWRRPLLACALSLGFVACDQGILPPGVSIPDAFRISHVCADSFVISSRLLGTDAVGLPVSVFAWWTKVGTHAQQTATLHLHVPWAPDASVGSTYGVRVGAPANIPIQVTAAPNLTSTGIPLASSVSTTNSGPAVCAQSIPVLVRVRSVLGLGVSGAVSPAGDSIATGTPLTWSFTPTDGATSVDVRINGNSVGASGKQVVDRELLITAVGITSHAAAPQIVPLVTEARALLTAPNPRVAAEKLLNDLVALLDQVDETTGDQMLADFQAQAFTSDADVDAVVQFDSLLNNVVLKVNIPSSPAMRAPTISFPSEPTTYFVAAGILTTQEKVVATARVVRSLIRDRSMLGENDLIRSFVSPTMTGLTKDVRGCIARVFSLSGIRDRVNGFLTYCLPVYGGLLDSNDFIEASSQIMKQWYGGIPSRQTSLAFMDSLIAYRQRGFHLLIDAHSQGTLIAREAITELANQGLYLPKKDSTCIGVVAMAGPTSGNWPMPLTQFREFATEGDIVADGGGSQALRITTDLTRQRDSALASISKLNFPLRIAVNLMYGVQLHDFVGVYLGEKPPVDYMLSSNTVIRKECETAEVRSALGKSYQISKGEQFPIGLYFQAYNWNGHVLPTPNMQFTSDQPSIAEMITNVTVAGRAIGDATVSAHSGPKLGSILMNVRAAPFLGIGGSYAGTWHITDPVISGALSISLTESGSVTVNGEPQISGTVTYSHPAGTFTVPILDGKVSLGGIYKTITFRMSTPEFPNPDSWANVSLDIRGGGTLSGGATLYFQSGLVRESRGWDLNGGP